VEAVAGERFVVVLNERSRCGHFPKRNLDAKLPSGHRRGLGGNAAVAKARQGIWTKAFGFRVEPEEGVGVEQDGYV
jgi:hypothetical protein